MDGANMLRNVLLIILAIGLCFGAVYKITISNPNNYDLTDYQVKIDLSAYGVSRYLKVCSDISCSSILNFCYEQPNGECNTTFSKIIWVKVPHIPAGGSVDIYVFDGETTNYATTGNNVFNFYYDFSTDPSAEFTESYYSYCTEGYIFSWTPGYVKVNLDGCFHTYTHNSYVLTDGVVETRFLSEKEIGVVFRFQSNDYSYLIIIQDSTSPAGSSLLVYKRVGGPGDLINSYAISNPHQTWHTVKFAIVGQYLKYIYFDSQLITTYLYMGSDFTSGKVGFYAFYVDNYALFDWIRIRKYADQEPIVSITNVAYAVAYISKPKDGETITTSKYTIYWEVQAESDSNYITRLYVNGNLVYESPTTSITVGETHPYSYDYNFTLEGDYNIYVEVYNIDSGLTDSNYVNVSVDLYDINYIWTNQNDCGVDANGNYYCKSFAYKVVARCGYLGQDTNVIVKIDDNNYQIFILPCDNVSREFTGTYDANEGSHSSDAYIYRIEEEDYVSDGNKYSFVIDKTSPTIQIDLNLPSNGFYTTIPSAQAKLIVNDNLSPTIHCDYTINDVNYSEDINNEGSATQNFTPIDGNNKVVATCTDLAGNKTTSTKAKWFYKKYIKALDEFLGSAINLANYDSVVVQALGNNVFTEYNMKTNSTTAVYYVGTNLPEVFRIVATQSGSQFYREMKADFDTNINIYLVDLNTKQLSQVLFKIVSYVGYDCYVKVYKPNKVIYFGPINQLDYSYLTYLVNNETYYVDVICESAIYSKGWITVYGAATYTLLINQVTIDETVSQIYKYISYSLDINTDLNVLNINVASLDPHPVVVKAVVYEDINKVYENTLTNASVQISIPCSADHKYRIFLTIKHPKVGTVEITRVLAFPQYIEEIFPNIEVYKWGSLLFLLGVTALMSEGIGAGGLIVAVLSAFCWYMGWLPLTWVGIMVILIIGIYSYIRKSI